MEVHVYTAGNWSTAKTVKLTVAIVLISAVFCFAVISFIMSSLKTCEPYLYSIELIEADSEIMDFLGEGYELKGLVSGSLVDNADSTGRVSLSYKLKGKNGISKVHVEAEKKRHLEI